MNYCIATTDDLDFLATWNHQLIQDEGHSNPMSVEQLRDRMAGWLTGEYRAVIFSIEDEPVAYALYWEDANELYLRQFFVDRGHRGQGIGTQAIRVLSEQVWPQDKRLTVSVLAPNTAGVAFWRSVGYRDYSLTLEILPTGRTSRTK